MPSGRRQRWSKSGVCFRSYWNSINSGPHLIVYVYIEFLSNLQCCGKRVWDLVLQSSSIGPATHVDFQICTFKKHSCFFAFEDFVL